MESRRLTAKKCSLKEIHEGRFVKKQGFESSYVLTNLGRRLSRVRIMGIVVDKFVRPDDKYATITIDDGTETIRCKSFINVKIFNDIIPGFLVEVFGRIREYNDEIYIIPEIITKPDTNFETLRKLELEKIYREQKQKIAKINELRKQSSDIEELKSLAKDFMSPEDVESIIEAEDIIKTEIEEKTVEKIEAKDKILKLIENSLDGIKYNEIIEKSGLDENKVDQVIQDLLESGICFEPKPGLIKKL
ncbi:MAG: hypothetical protein J7K26_02740 [Candidatus Aenigmarchaeota archaeon]|nr:hypothetical protein [Candidatus Aenigmarchaeota archaeon]